MFLYPTWCWARPISDSKCLLYFRYKGTVIKNRYGPGNGRILMDNVQCVGNETSIDDCDHAGWSVHNCNHTEDVAVSCGTSPVRHGNSHIYSQNHIWKIRDWKMADRIAKLENGGLNRQWRNNLPGRLPGVVTPVLLKHFCIIARN